MELKFQINHIRFTVLTTAASLLILHIWMEEMKLLLPSKKCVLCESFTLLMVMTHNLPRSILQQR